MAEGKRWLAKQLKEQERRDNEPTVINPPNDGGDHPHGSDCPHRRGNASCDQCG